MTKLEQAIERLERAVARLEAAGLAARERPAEDMAQRRLAGDIAARVEAALARIAEVIGGEG